MATEQEETIIRVTFDTDGKASLNLVSRTLADLNALYELVVSLTDPKYSDRTRVVKEWRVRRSSRLQAYEQLSVRRIHLSSPLVMDIVVPMGIVATSTWAVVQALEKVANWQTEKRIRRTREQREAFGLERDQVALQRERLALARETAELEDLIEEQQAQEAFRQVANRLSEDLPIVSVAPPPNLPAPQPRPPE